MATGGTAAKWVRFRFTKTLVSFPPVYRSSRFNINLRNCRMNGLNRPVAAVFNGAAGERTAPPATANNREVPQQLMGNMLRLNVKRNYEYHLNTAQHLVVYYRLNLT